MTFPFHFIFDLLRAELNLGFGRAKRAKKKKKKSRRGKQTKEQAHSASVHPLGRPRWSTQRHINFREARELEVTHRQPMGLRRALCRAGPGMGTGLTQMCPFSAFKETTTRVQISVLGSTTTYWLQPSQWIGWPAFLFPGCFTEHKIRVTWLQEIFCSEIGSCSFQKGISIFGHCRGRGKTIIFSFLLFNSPVGDTVLG